MSKAPSPPQHDQAGDAGRKCGQEKGRRHCRQDARRQGQRRLIRAQEGEGQDGRQQGCRSKTGMRGHRGFPRGTGYGVQPAPAAAGRQGCAWRPVRHAAKRPCPGGCRNRRQFGCRLNNRSRSWRLFRYTTGNLPARRHPHAGARMACNCAETVCCRRRMARRRGAAARCCGVSPSSLPSACRCPASSSLPFRNRARTCPCAACGGSISRSRSWPCGPICPRTTS